MPSHRILIVDDSALIRKGVKDFIGLKDADIVEASNGFEGFEIVQKQKFDLIITDNDMPQMDGLEFCRRLKKNEATRSIPVIMLSSDSTDEDINRGFIAGISAYILKDRLKTSIRKTVREILSKSLIQRERLIMVVDDSSVIRRLVEAGLSEAGFQVATAENGRKALEFIRLCPPHLILSDIDMPEMDGFAFCDEIQKDPKLSSIPFVVMSANSGRGHMKRMLQRGAEAYIVKPFNVDQLVILVEKLLSDQYLLLLKEKERIDTERSMMLASITSLVTALEARDAYTRGHSEAVSSIVSGMAILFGESKENIDLITIGTKLHDIGKIGIRDSVLLKPGKLTKEEFGQIKRHPLIGASILKSIQSLSAIIPIVKNHHERFDGKGYPQGLKGNYIPLWARMTAVADTYHALTSDRPYRLGMPLEEALDIIEDAKGTQLCPESTDLFLKWIEKEGENSELIINNKA